MDLNLNASNFPVFSEVQQGTLNLSKKKTKISTKLVKEEKWKLCEGKLRLIFAENVNLLDTEAFSNQGAKFFSNIYYYLRKNKKWEIFEAKGLGTTTRQHLIDCIANFVMLPPAHFFAWQKKMDQLGIWFSNNSDKQWTNGHWGAITGYLEYLLDVKDPKMLTAQDKWGRTPMNYALFFRHFPVIEFLLNKGIRISSEDFCNFCFLGDHELVRFLLKHVDPNEQDKFGNTPLIKAVVGNQKEIVNILIEANVKLNIKNKKEHSACQQAVHHGYDEIASLLVNAGVPWESHYDSSLCSLKFERNDLRACAKLSKEQPKLLKEYKQILLIKAIGHSTHQEGAVIVKPTNDGVKEGLSPLLVNLEGGEESVWFRKMTKATRSICRRHPNILSKIERNLLCQTLSFAADIRMMCKLDIISGRIKKGFPTALITGLIEHSVVAFFWQPYFALCNRGDESRKSIEVFRYETEIDENILISIAQASQKDNENYRELFFKVLPEKLGFKKGKVEKAIENGCTIPLQTQNNCSWTSPEMVGWILPLLQRLFGSERGRLISKIPSNKKIKFAVESMKTTFESWRIYNQLYFVERYMEKPYILRRLPKVPKESSKYVKNLEIIRKAFAESQSSKIDPGVAEDRSKLLEYFKKNFSIN